MYDLQDWAAVQRVYKQTRSKRATAKILGMSRNTVRSLLEEKEAPVYKRTVYKSKIDDFKEQIIEWRCEPLPRIPVCDNFFRRKLARAIFCSCASSS